MANTLKDIFEREEGFVPPSGDIQDKLHRSCYERWRRLVIQVYGDSGKEAGLTMCDDWKDYVTFFQWFKDNHYEIPGQRLCINKDIRFAGNTHYSPGTCLLVPGCVHAFISGAGACGDASGNMASDIKKRKKKMLGEMIEPFQDLLPVNVKDVIDRWEFFPAKSKADNNLRMDAERMGLRRKNNAGEWMEIVGYKNRRDIIVRFDRTGREVDTEYSRFMNGSVRDRKGKYAGKKKPKQKLPLVIIPRPPRRVIDYRDLW